MGDIVALVMVRGIPLEVHDSPDFVSDEIRRTKDFYEADIIDFIGPRVRGGLTVDVGAMIGNHTVALAALWGALVLAFEPAPKNLEVMYHNVEWLKRNGFVVNLQERALSDKSCYLGLSTPEPGNQGHTLVVQDDAEYFVPAFMLDDYKIKECALIKIDVEGHEPQVLEGARETIARCKPFILLEDWTGGSYAKLLPGYHVMKSWQDAHQTSLYAPD